MPRAPVSQRHGDVWDLFCMFDMDGSGSIDVGEVRRALTHTHTHKYNTHTCTHLQHTHATHIHKSLWRVPTAAVGSHGGRQVRALVARLGVVMTEAEFEAAVGSMDSDGTMDGDDEIEFEEFLTWWESFSEGDGTGDRPDFKSGMEALLPIMNRPASPITPLPHLQNNTATQGLDLPEAPVDPPEGAAAAGLPREDLLDAKTAVFTAYAATVKHGGARAALESGVARADEARHSFFRGQCGKYGLASSTMALIASGFGLMFRRGTPSRTSAGGRTLRRWPCCRRRTCSATRSTARSTWRAGWSGTG